jgi:hypothetical protein
LFLCVDQICNFAKAIRKDDALGKMMRPEELQKGRRRKTRIINAPIIFFPPCICYELVTRLR